MAMRKARTRRTMARRTVRASSAASLRRRALTVHACVERRVLAVCALRHGRVARAAKSSACRGVHLLL